VTFELPYALDTKGDMIAYERGEKGVPYRCPGCLSKVLFRHGIVKESHFAHFPNVSCSREAVLKRIGQRLLIDKFSGTAPPRLDRVCPGVCKGVHQVPIPSGARPVQNYTMPSGELVDVMFLDPKDNPILAVTISGLKHHGHSASARIRGVPWVVINGKDILSKGISWFVESSEGEKDCPQCIRIREERRLSEEARRQADLEKFKRMKLTEESMEAWRKSPSRQAEYEDAINLLSRAGKIRKPLDHVGEWSVGGFTLLVKPHPCPCGRKAFVYTWPDGQPFGTVPIDPERLPSRIVRVEGTDLWSSQCDACKMPYKRIEP